MVSAFGKYISESGGRYFLTECSIFEKDMRTQVKNKRIHKL